MSQKHGCMYSCVASAVSAGLDHTQHAEWPQRNEGGLCLARLQLSRVTKKNGQ